MSQPLPRCGARHRAYSAALLASPGKLRVWRKPLYAKLNEDAGENSAAASSKGLFSSLGFGRRSARHSLLCFCLLCSPPGLSDNKKDELLLADGRRKCASAQLSPISAKRESEPIHT